MQILATFDKTIREELDRLVSSWNCLLKFNFCTQTELNVHAFASSFVFPFQTRAAGVNVLTFAKVLSANIMRLFRDCD
jgi:hypothetical protein